MPVAAEYKTKIKANAGKESRFIPKDMTITKARGANMAIVPKVVLLPFIGSISMLSSASSLEKKYAKPADRPKAINIHRNTLGRKFAEVMAPPR